MLTGSCNKSSLCEVVGISVVKQADSKHRAQDVEHSVVDSGVCDSAGSNHVFQPLPHESKIEQVP